MCFGLFAFIWSLRKKLTAPMMMFSIYVLVTGVERLIIESIRVNTIYPTGIFKGFTQAEVISVSLIILGALGMVLSYRQHRKKEALTINQ